jgi:hypothetical protein
MKHLGSRAIAQRSLLEFAVRKLGDISDEFVFLGGCSTALFITDPASPDVRSTMDVDCIVDVLSLSAYYHLEQQLQDRGFKKLFKDTVVCRWHYDDLILDVMPTDEKILGFSNQWYKAAIKNAITHQLAEDVIIRSVTAPYFLGTKLEAFGSRGNNDFMGSHDFEDIIAIIDGRAELIDEVKQTDPQLRLYLADTFSKMLLRDDFQTALPGLLNYGSVTYDRVQLVLERIKCICDRDG